MSDDQNTTQTPADEKTVGAASSLLAEVADRVKGSAPQVRAQLLDNMVSRELAKRVDTLDKALQKRTELARDLNKVNRPDQETFNADGSTATQSYTKARLEEIKKAKEALSKLDNAIEKAFTGDFQKLNEVCK